MSAQEEEEDQEEKIKEMEQVEDEKIPWARTTRGWCGEFLDSCQGWNR